MLTDLNGKPVHHSSERTNSMIEIEPIVNAGVYLLLAKTGNERLIKKVIKN